MVHPRWLTSTQKLVVLLLYRPIKWRDTTYNKPHCTSCSHSQSLSHTITEIVYNATIQYTIILQYFLFIGEIPWENTMCHPIPWVRKLLANKHPKKFPSGASPSNLHCRPAGLRTPQLGWVYSKPRVQIQLNNNISGSKRSGSTTNNLHQYSMIVSSLMFPI